MEGISGNIQGAVPGEIYWNSRGDINWSGFFGNDGDGDELSMNNIVGYNEITVNMDTEGYIRETVSKKGRH